MQLQLPHKQKQPPPCLASVAEPVGLIARLSMPWRQEEMFSWYGHIQVLAVWQYQDDTKS